MAYAFSMNPYSAPAEICELNEVLKPSNQKHWMFWLSIGFALILFAALLTLPEIFRGPAFGGAVAPIIMIAGVGCLTRALVAARRTVLS